MILLLCCCAAAAAAAENPPQGKQLYDALYSVGYHNNTNLHHAGHLLTAVSRLTRLSGHLHSVLDVGCSHGAVVQKLWRRGLSANGVDISSLAVEKAVHHRMAPATGSPPRCLLQPCFQVAKADNLPFADGQFDAIMSSDVLEHVEAGDVVNAVAEVARVARRFIVLKISNRAESNVKELNQVRMHAGRSFNLHATIQGPSFWIRKFAEHGWSLHHMLEAEPHDRNYLRGAGLGLPWECCSYVFQPNSAPGARELARREMASMRSQRWFEMADRCVHWRRSYCNATVGEGDINPAVEASRGRWVYHRGAAVPSVDWRHI